VAFSSIPSSARARHAGTFLAISPSVTYTDLNVTLEVDTPTVAERPFRLGEWLVEPRLNRLTRDGESIQIELKMMGVLLCLARNAAEVVTRRQLVESVWDEGFVADNTITHAVAELRKAFGDSHRNPLFIETIHRRGYRLIAPVHFYEMSSFRSSATDLSFLAIARGIEIPLFEGENLIGRGPDATITIPSMKVSRHHAKITVEHDAASLEDLGSKNGTYLNGTKIQETVQLDGGDLIGVGCVTETVLVVDSLGKRTTESDSEV
jgi:DNA-binding winged helix-turn-helix (wHTH) protein